MFLRKIHQENITINTPITASQIPVALLYTSVYGTRRIFYLSQKVLLSFPSSLSLL